jgi:hypothetical protein
MGLVLGGYYVVASGLLTKAVRGEPSSPNFRPLVSGKSTAGNPPGTYPAIPLATPGPLAPEQSSPVPLSPLAAGAERPVAAASASAVKAPLSVSPLFTPRSAEVQGLPTVVKQAATAAVPPPPQGEIAVVSNVQGAAISVDGHRDPGWTTPQMIKDLSPGVHRIVVSKKGYREAAQSVTVVAGRATSLNAKLTIPRGEIDIATTQQGAEVLIDGKSYGSGPVRAEVDAGKHTFLVRQEGRQSVEGNLVVQDLATVQETITLPSNLAIPPALSASNVTVATIPPSATVYVDGAVMNGNTPISFHLSPGHHIVTISSSGFRPVRRKIDVTDDKPIAVDVILSR